MTEGTQVPSGKETKVRTGPVQNVTLKAKIPTAPVPCTAYREPVPSPRPPCFHGSRTEPSPERIALGQEDQGEALRREEGSEQGEQGGEGPRS